MLGLQLNIGETQARLAAAAPWREQPLRPHRRNEPEKTCLARSRPTAGTADKSAASLLMWMALPGGSSTITPRRIGLAESKPQQSAVHAITAIPPRPGAVPG